MIVVDASALANALVDDGDVGEAARSRLGDDDHWLGPDHLLVEVYSVIRGLSLGGKVAPARAVEALDALAEVAIEAVPVARLLGRMWQLRDNLSGYDAAYVAGAEVEGCALVTADQRVAGAPGLRCEVRLALPG